MDTMERKQGVGRWGAAWAAAMLAALAAGCVAPKPGTLPPTVAPLPAQFPSGTSTTNGTLPGWQAFFRDPVLNGLISVALTNNQELNILLQEIAATKAEAEGRRGALFPFVRLGARSGAEKVSKHTRDGAVEESLEIEPGRRFPEPLQNHALTADLDWEVDIWRKLRNERDAAVQRYVASQEGRRFAVTHLVSEIAEAYYELLSLDAQLEIFQQMVAVQERALESVRLKKAAARVTELAVQRFEAEVMKNRSHLYVLRQGVTEMENRLNALTGRYPEPIRREGSAYDLGGLGALEAGLPAELLRNRPDIRQAEAEVIAAGLELKAAGARFYPSLNLTAVLGLESFTLGSPILAKENLIYGASANLVGPLVNRSAIHAAFRQANARQVAAIHRYQQVVLKAYVEAVNALTEIRNTGEGYALKERQVAALAESASLSSQLFDSARADYTEVLLTQRETLEARVELVELRQKQLLASVKAYRALGGGQPAAEPR